MSPSEVAAIKSWVKERWATDSWAKTTPDVWTRVPADAVWSLLVAVPSDQKPPTPGQVRQQTLDVQSPLEAGWEAWGPQLGYPKGATVMEAARIAHGMMFQTYSETCQCFPSGAEKYAASEHIVCHIVGCDLHGGVT